MRLTLSMLLISAVSTMAGVITSVSATGSGCSVTQSTSGETTAGASAACPGASGNASANVFSLGVEGTKVGGTFSLVVASASFDYPILATGTDQPGFLLVFWTYFPAQDSIGTVAGSNASLNGHSVGNCCVPTRGYLYLPYAPGVPTELYASLTGVAGASDITWPGDLDAGFSIVQIAVTSQGTIDPFAPGFPDYMRIPGASWQIVPEPSAIYLALAGFGFMALVWYHSKVRQVTQLAGQTTQRKP